MCLLLSFAERGSGDVTFYPRRTVEGAPQIIRLTTDVTGLHANDVAEGNHLKTLTVFGLFQKFLIFTASFRLKSYKWGQGRFY